MQNIHAWLDEGKMAFRSIKSVTTLTAGVVLLSACSTYDPYTNKQEVSKATIGAGIGAASGAVIGLITGDNSKERQRNALIGAGVGALAGGGVGLYMDRQEEKLREELRNSGVKIERVGDEIRLNMDQSITFDVDSAQIRSGSYNVLASVAKVLREFDKTMIDVTGHTDSDGGENYNQALSERRARSVAQEIVSKGVLPERLLIAGYGETRPIASNTTAPGKQANRRVEIQISPILATRS
jgi:outer membrane protein OmpA-like peptidoglycan-associated protein